MNKVELIEAIEHEFKKDKQNFGRGNFYQSFPLLGLEGQRPTDVRIIEYGLMDVINKNRKILDIGSNIGFFDMTIASEVKSVLGIEYNEQLVKIANLVATELEVKNANFIRRDFNEWEKETSETFDVIFSFAVHYWLKVTPITYCKRLFEFLNSGGYIFIESQNINTVDKEFKEYCDEFIRLGMELIKEGNIKDDGIIERKFYVLRKI